MAEPTEPTERLVSTVERAVAVLVALAESPVDLGTNEIARRTGINASSVSRLLATLAVDELVRRVPESGRYRLGVRLIQLGNAALDRVDLREVARPHLVALTEATGETATLSLPGEQMPMTVDFVQSPSTVRSVAEVGRPSVPHATAVGKVFLAYRGGMPDGPLESYTPRTITDRAEVAREVARVRECGWAEAMREREGDLSGIAAPVLDERGVLVAILGIQGPAGRFDHRAMAAAVGQLLDHAVRLSSDTLR
ncbi:MAG: helix-turn-helix domain-containing protein [Streptosporangiales bacterium]|nr:helix-turn-helix domain-containing protein [Streptosporangiales bacterium]